MSAHHVRVAAAAVAVLVADLPARTARLWANLFGTGQSR